MYFLGRGYDESQEEAAIKMREDRKEIDALKTPKDFEEYEKKLMQDAKQMMQLSIDEALKNGRESKSIQLKVLVPEEI